MLRPRPSSFRKHWALAPGTVFLNHGSFGACPRPVLELQQELRSQMEAEPVQFLWRRFEERLDPSRGMLAKFIGVRRRDVAFVTNATAGVNAVLRSLKLRRGDELLTTSCAYNACRNALFEISQSAGARLVIAEVPFPLEDDDQIVEAILARVTRRTRLALIDHVTSDTAMVFPLARIVRALEEAGVETLVDGAHAPGMLPLEISRLGAAYYSGNLHKWVCAPKGAAFLWVREDKQADVHPPVISHGNSRKRAGYTAFQDRFDWAGTFDPTAWFCVGEAIRWMGELLPAGWIELRRRNRQLAREARRVLCARLGVAPPCPEEVLGAMATIPLPRELQKAAHSGRIDHEQLRLYDDYGIEVPFSRAGNPPIRYFRISAQIYNTPEEYQYLADALAQFA